MDETNADFSEALTSEPPQNINDTVQWEECSDKFKIANNIVDDIDFMTERGFSVTKEWTCSINNFHNALYSCLSGEHCDFQIWISTSLNSSGDNCSEIQCRRRSVYQVKGAKHQCHGTTEPTDDCPTRSTRRGTGLSLEIRNEMFRLHREGYHKPRQMQYALAKSLTDGKKGGCGVGDSIVPDILQVRTFMSKYLKQSRRRGRPLSTGNRMKRVVNSTPKDLDGDDESFDTLQDRILNFETVERCSLSDNSIRSLSNRERESTDVKEKKIYCPHSKCHAMMKSDDMLTHIHKAHPHHVRVESRSFSLRINDFGSLMESVSGECSSGADNIFPTFVEVFIRGCHFYLISHVTNIFSYFWVAFLGCEEERTSFSYELSVKRNSIGEWSFKSPSVLTLHTPSPEVIDRGECLVVKSHHVVSCSDLKSNTDGARKIDTDETSNYVTIYLKISVV